MSLALKDKRLLLDKVVWGGVKRPFQTVRLVKDPDSLEHRDVLGIELKKAPTYHTLLAPMDCLIDVLLYSNNGWEGGNIYLVPTTFPVLHRHHFI